MTQALNGPHAFLATNMLFFHQINLWKAIYFSKHHQAFGAWWGNLTEARISTWVLCVDNAWKWMQRWEPYRWWTNSLICHRASDVDSTIPNLEFAFYLSKKKDGRGVAFMYFWNISIPLYILIFNYFLIKENRITYFIHMFMFLSVYLSNLFNSGLNSSVALLHWNESG